MKRTHCGDTCVFCLFQSLSFLSKLIIHIQNSFTLNGNEKYQRETKEAGSYGKAWKHDYIIILIIIIIMIIVIIIIINIVNITIINITIILIIFMNFHYMGEGEGNAAENEAMKS